MKKITQLLFLLTLAASFSFCKVQKYTPADYPKGQIIFGSGGGIVGKTTEFVLFENGQLFSKKALYEDYANVKKIEQNVVKQLFNNIEFLNLGKVKLDKAGNIYSFIQFKNTDSDNRIMWGGGEEPPKKVKDFYKILSHLSKETDND